MSIEIHPYHAAAFLNGEFRTGIYTFDGGGYPLDWWRLCTYRDGSVSLSSQGSYVTYRDITIALEATSHARPGTPLAAMRRKLEELA